MCRKFVEEHEVSCPESIYQVDSTNFACTDFVADLCECVGFYRYNPEEEDEE